MPIYDPTNEFFTHPVRYIRDSVSGSNANSGSHWVEIQAFDSAGNNVAKGKPAKVVSGTNTGASVALVTDGNTASEGWYGTDGSNPTIEVDLGAVYDIENVKVWHYYADSRTYYSPVTKVSSDGTNWITISNGSTYAETSSGKTWSCASVPSQQLLVHHQIGKLYDNDGTTNYQISKVYDNDGTTNYLIYQATRIVSLNISFERNATSTTYGYYNISGTVDGKPYSASGDNNGSAYQNIGNVLFMRYGDMYITGGDLTSSQHGQLAVGQTYSTSGYGWGNSFTITGTYEVED